MSEYVIITEDELYHSRSHKYSKREWKNGRWRYWYEDVKSLSSTIFPKKRTKDKTTIKVSFDNTPKPVPKNSTVISLTKSEAERLNKVQRGQAFAKKLLESNRNLLNDARKSGDTATERYAAKQVNAYGRDYAAYMQEMSRIRVSALTNARSSELQSMINYQKAKRKKKSQKSKGKKPSTYISTPASASTINSAVGSSRKKYVSNKKAKKIYVRK